MGGNLVAGLIVEGVFLVELGGMEERVEMGVLSLVASFLI